MRRLATLLALAAAGCTPPHPAVTIAPALAPPTRTWQGMITLADLNAINASEDRWRQALAAVPKAQHAKLEGEGALLDPSAAQPLPALPPGPYHCRLVRLGGGRGLQSFTPDFCYVEGDATARSFTKQDGSNLFGGWLWEDGPTRLIFMGSTRTSKASVAPAYGTAPNRNVAGVVERVSPFRWRLVLTRSARSARLDVYELVPVTPVVPNARPAVPKV